MRLLNHSDYDSVMSKPTYKIYVNGLLLLARDTGNATPRLGFILKKKNLKQAVRRNRLKRFLREYFRLNQHLLPPVDCVVISRRDIASLTTVQLKYQIGKMWTRLQDQCKKFSSA